GQVPDVRPHIQDAALVVVPLQIARGIQNKILEAMAMERAVVASPQALQGLAVSPGHEAASASTKAEWISAVTNLLDNPSDRLAYGKSGRKFVEKNHCWDRCLKSLERLLQLSVNDSLHTKINESTIEESM